MAELSDEELKKLPPAVRAGYEKAQRAKESPGEGLGEMFAQMADSLSADRKANLDNIIKKAKEKRRDT